MRFSIPKTWRKRKLADIANVQTGIAKGKKNITDPVTRPYLRVANVQDGHLNLSEIKTIEVARHELDRFSLKVGDVLFTEGGDFDKLGRGTVWQGEIPNCLHQNHVFAVRMKNGEMLPYFLATYAASFWGRTYFLSCSKQTTNLASINSTQLKEMLLPVPPLPEQRKIAAILSTWDRAVELTEKLIVAKQKRKQALVQQLLTGKVRLPGFKGDWRHEEIGRHLEQCSFRIPSTTAIPIYTSSRAGLRRQDEYYAGRTVTNDGEYGIVPNNCFVFRHMSDDGVFVFHINKTGGDIAVSKEYPVFRAINLDRDFLLAKLNHTEEFRAFANSQKAGGTRTRLYFSRLRLWKTFLPSLSEQRAIADVLNAQDSEVVLLNRRLDALKLQKKGLMQQLLTGKVRMKVSNGEATYA